MKRILFTFLLASPIAFLFFWLGSFFLYFPLVVQEGSSPSFPSFFIATTHFLSDHLASISIILSFIISHIVITSFYKVQEAKKQAKK